MLGTPRRREAGHGTENERRADHLCTLTIPSPTPYGEGGSWANRPAAARTPPRDLRMPMIDANVTGPMLFTLAAAEVGGGVGSGALVLMNWLYPVLLLLVFVGWAWIVSKVYDKHAAQFFLPRRKWNLLHLGMGLLALGAVLLMGVVMAGSAGAFWAGLGIAVVILVADLYAYMHVANRDDRVPERYHIRLSMPKLGADKDDKKKAAQQAKVKLVIKGQDEKGKYTKLLAAPMAETPEFEVRAAAEALYEKALASRASQVEILPLGKDNLYVTKMLVDGVYTPGEQAPAPAAAKIMDFWKAAAGLDVADRRRKLQSLVSVEQPAGKHILRVTSIGAQGGMRVTLLLDPETAVTRKIDAVGLLDVQMKELAGLVEEGKGVVLVTSPPDGGRTTLLYSILRMHDAYTTNVQTVEIDPQASLEGVRGNKFDAQAEGNQPAGSAGPEFSTLVRSILRRDPQVVGVAELPDQATAKEIAKADHERTRVYVSFRAGDPLLAVQAWVKTVGDAKLAGECLHGVVTGRLVRKLCTNCRVAYPPGADMLKKLGVPEGKVAQLFKKGGQVLIKNKPEICPVCGGGGYIGQEGIFEVCPVGKEERDLVVQGNLQGLKAAWRKRQIPTLQHVAIRKAVDGTTSVEEVTRVTAAEKPEGAATAPATGTSSQRPPTPPNPSAPSTPAAPPAKA